MPRTSSSPSRRRSRSGRRIAGALYNLASQKLNQGQPAKARDLFQDFLNRYPKDELAANAQYWLGETYYAREEWNDAIVEFQKVLKEYKGSDKVPDALLKIGMSFQAQGDCQNALLFFDEVGQAHKTAPAAKVAHDRARRMPPQGDQDSEPQPVAAQQSILDLLHQRDQVAAL